MYEVITSPKNGQAEIELSATECEEIIAAGRAGATAETPANGASVAAQATPDEVADDSDDQTH
jgi:hypothetical protein